MILPSDYTYLSTNRVHKKELPELSLTVVKMEGSCLL